MAAHRPETPPLSEGRLGAGLCLHPPGCCPAGSICSIASATEFPLSAPWRPTAALPLLGPGDGTKPQARDIPGSAGRRELVADEQRACPIFGVEEQQADAAAVDGAAKHAPMAVSLSGALLGLGMKRSLRRFLEKRAARLREVSSSPYSAAEKVQFT